MKKISILFLLVCLGFAGCKKDRTCKCTSTSSASSTTSSYTIQHSTKKNAQSTCTSGTSDYVAPSGGTGHTTCELD